MTTNRSNKKKSLLTLSIDIGGTGIKMMVIDEEGKPVTEYIRDLTPKPATPKAVLGLIKQMITDHHVVFDHVAAGFPGVVRNGVVYSAPHLDPSWVGVDFQKKLQDLTKRPTHIGNDADVQGYGDICGKGVELVITLGTGMGSALFIDGKLVPNLELGHHPFRIEQTYEQLLGEAALERDGVGKWNTNLKRAIALWSQTFNYDCLYLGGGNTRKIRLKLPNSVVISSNVKGVLGGIKLWAPHKSQHGLSTKRSR